MTARIPLPPGFDAQAFRVAEATTAGIGRSRLAGSDLSRPFWGIRVPTTGNGTELDGQVEQLCRALRVRMPFGAFFSHTTAAQILRLPLPLALTAARPIHVGVPAPQRAMDARGIRGHSIALVEGDLETWNGLPLTSPSRTWLDLAPRLSLYDLVAMGDYLIRWERPLTTLAALTMPLTETPAAEA